MQLWFLIRLKYKTGKKYFKLFLFAILTIDIHKGQTCIHA